MRLVVTAEAHWLDLNQRATRAPERKFLNNSKVGWMVGAQCDGQVSIRGAHADTGDPLRNTTITGGDDCFLSGSFR
jgi:hypothetical protein